MIFLNWVYPKKLYAEFFLNASKLSQNEAAIEKIKTIFMGILRDVKSDMAGNQPTGAIMTAEISQELFSLLPNVPRSELTVDDIAEVIVTYIQAVVPLDENDSTLPLYKCHTSFIIKND